MDQDDAAWEEWLASAEPEPRTRRIDGFARAAIVVVVVTAAGLIALWPRSTSVDQAAFAALAIPSELYAAEISAVELTGCPSAEGVECIVVDFKLAEGPDSGSVYTQAFPSSSLLPDFVAGDVAILARRTPNATVIDRDIAACSFDPGSDCVVFELVVQTSEDVEVRTTYEQLPEFAANVIQGEEAIVEFLPGDEQQIFSVSAPTVDVSYQFSGDFQRRPVLWAIAALFAVVVVTLGRWRGAMALAGLTASLGVIMLFVLPAILSGRNPVLVAVVGSATIAIVTLYLAHGFNRTTTVAMLGMIAALVLTAVLSTLSVELAQFSGFASEEATLLSLFEGIDISGLLLAGIVLGAAGALDDVTVTQASAVRALHRADPEQDQRTLFARALHIGRDHIASTVNTLLLAYAGAALPLLVLFVLSSQSLGAIANSEIVAVEIVRTLVGSIGLVAAVPLTTLLASIAATSHSDPRGSSNTET